MTIIYGTAGDDDLEASSNGLGDTGIVYGLDGNDTLQGTAPDLFTGSELYGGNGNDTLNGQKGGDILDGGAGDDILFGGITLYLIEFGTFPNNNWMIGGAGADVMTGGGVDNVRGYVFTDTVSYETATSGIVLDLNDASRNIGDAAGDVMSEIEAIVGTSFDDIIAAPNVNLSSHYEMIMSFSGGDGNDQITADGILNGDNGDDRLVSGSGSDSLDGGNGADALYGGGGNDKIFGGIYGGDRLVGGAGADQLQGSLGSDWAYFHTATVGVTASLAAGSGSGGEAAGDTYINIENLYGSSHADMLTGDGLFNQLLGNTGADTLTGGAGGDSFIFRDVTDSTVAASGRDTITDFSNAQDDKIDLRPIDADGDAGNGNTAFTFTAGGAFTGSGHELIVQGGAGVYMVLGDTDGDGVADFGISVHSDGALAASDVLL